MQNFNLSDVKKNALLQMAGKKLGADPNQLKEKLESGQIGDVVAGMDQNTKDQLNSLLQNPSALESLLGSEQVQALLKNLRG